MFRWFLVTFAVVEIGWAIVSVVAMTYGTLLSWPDYVHVNFGVPLTFATHTLSTFAGPADKWDMDLGALVADLGFWLVGMIAILLIGFGYLQTRIRKNPGV